MATSNHKQQQGQQNCVRQAVVVESHAVESQCETVCDEEEEDDDLTEEDEVEEEDEDEDEDEDDDEGDERDDSEETLTDISSSPQRTKHAASKTRGACLSPDIQKLVSQVPEISQHFRIVGKIGEGIFTATHPTRLSQV